MVFSRFVGLQRLKLCDPTGTLYRLLADISHFPPNCAEIHGPAYASFAPMSAIVYRVNRKNGDYVKAAVIPANHSQEAHFGVIDGIIVGALLLCTLGLVGLVLLLH